MRDLYDETLERAGEVRAIIDGATADGHLLLKEVFQIVGGFCRAAVKVAERIEAAGPEKRKLVTDALVRLWDEKLAPLDLPGPDRILDPWFRESLPIWGGYLIDEAVGLYNWLGWDL